jgi:hypothetical protein
MKTASNESNLLKIDSNGITNFFKWINTNAPSLQAKYGHLADYLTNLPLVIPTVRYVPPEILAINWTAPANGPAMNAAQRAKFELQKYEKLDEDRTKRIAALKALEPSLFADKRLLISADSWGKVSTHADFPAALAAKDPHLLHDIIVRVHVTEVRATDPAGRVASQVALKDQLSRLRQSTTESIQDFKMRYDHMQSACVSVGIIRSPDDMEAQEFLMKLDRNRYLGLQTQIQNNIGLGVAPPQTLDAMYNAASSRIENTSSSSTKYGHQVALLADKQSSKPKKNKRGRDKPIVNEEVSNKKTNYKILMGDKSNAGDVDHQIIC